jgi:ferredoxin
MGPIWSMIRREARRGCVACDACVRVCVDTLWIRHTSPLRPMLVDSVHSRTVLGLWRIQLAVLVHELISIQVWRQHVYPQLVELDFVAKSSMTAYMVVRLPMPYWRLSFCLAQFYNSVLVNMSLIDVICRADQRADPLVVSGDLRHTNAHTSRTTPPHSFTMRSRC